MNSFEIECFLWQNVPGTYLPVPLNACNVSGIDIVTELLMIMSTNFEYDVYYQTRPGNYPFSYTDHNGVQHPLPGEYGVLEIVADSGTEGALFNSGEDGDDLYIDLILLSTGPVIENYDYFTIASTLNYSQ